MNKEAKDAYVYRQLQSAWRAYKDDFANRGVELDPAVEEEMERAFYWGAVVAGIIAATVGVKKDETASGRN